jgi:hypothetical protein
MLECAPKALSSGDLSSFCDPNTTITTTTPGDGASPTISFFARRTLELANGLIDCGAKANSCILIAITQDNISTGISVTGGGTAAAKHPNNQLSRTSATRRYVRSQALQAAARSKIPNIASTPLSFDPPTN